MHKLLSTKYYPYGSQYYRAPSPPPEDWDRDLGRMAELGFNTVKFWAQWRWNHPSEERFYWEDLDGLMDTAHKHGLRVMLNTIVDTAPAWIYRKYPDASMLTLGGRRIGPQTQPHRQIGGLGVCLNHEGVMSHLFRFLEACFERYSDHPGLEIWNVGSEPELTQSMSEMRAYAADASKMGDMLCYCDHCAAAFRRWLQQKYADVDALNLAWNRNYASIEDAELPKTRNTFNDLIDWRMFFVDTLGANVRRRFEVAEKVDAGRHPLMCHHVFIQGFPLVSTANDPWNVGQYGDLHGFTQMDDPMMCDILRCCARDKPVMSAEMLMLMGYTLDMHAEITEDDIKRHVFTGIAADIKGYVFWQYRPELLGREAPAWGLSGLDGSDTPWLDAYARVGQVLQPHTDFLFEARPTEAEVAILYHPENQIFAWAATGSEFSATDSLLGAHRALYEKNLIVDFIHAKEVETDVLDRYRVIVLTLPYLLNERVAARLKDWVRRGGTLISEAYCGAWNLEEGRHQTVVPGYGLHEVFGARQQNAVPPSDHHFALIQGATRSDAEATIRPGMNAEPGGGYVSWTKSDPSGGLGFAEMHLWKDLPGLGAGSRVVGSTVKETFVLDGAEAIAGYNDGQPAILRNDYGEGRAYLVGSFVALPYWRKQPAQSGALLPALVDDALAGLAAPNGPGPHDAAPDNVALRGAVARPRIIGGTRVRVDVLRAGAEVMVVVRNLEPRAVEVTVQIPDVNLGRLDEQFGAAALECVLGAGGSSFSVALERGSVKVYRGAAER